MAMENLLQAGKKGEGEGGGERERERVIDELT